LIFSLFHFSNLKKRKNYAIANTNFFFRNFIFIFGFLLFRKDLKTNERREKSEKENGSLLDLSSRQDEKEEKEGECYNSHQTMKKRKFTSLEKKEENVETLMDYSENCEAKKGWSAFSGSLKTILFG